MESLYRKYRPLTFESVVGQQHIVSTLEHAVAEGRLSHAYLFCGPRGTGKTTMARILAKALLCERSEAARADGASGCMACGTCPECTAIAEGTHPDVYELDAASRTGVDNVREEIINSVSFAPVRGAYKVYIIDEVHMLTTAAFNALLKTLEEPPAHVVFVLCTTDPQKLLETILSRCQRFDFHRISNEEIVGRMRYICEQEGFAFDEEALELVARHARGGMRDALSTLEQLSVFGGGAVRSADARALLGEVASTVLADFAEKIARRDTPGLFGMVREQAEAGNDVMELTHDLVGHLRDVYTAAIAGPRAELFDGTPEEVAAFVEEAKLFGDADRLARALMVLDDAALEMRNASDPRLVLEIACTRLARPEADLTLEALAERVARLEAQLAAGVPSAPMRAAALVGEAPGRGTAGSGAGAAGAVESGSEAGVAAARGGVAAAGQAFGAPAGAAPRERDRAGGPAASTHGAAGTPPWERERTQAATPAAPAFNVDAPGGTAASPVGAAGAVNAAASMTGASAAGMPGTVSASASVPAPAASAASAIPAASATSAPSAAPAASSASHEGPSSSESAAPVCSAAPVGAKPAVGVQGGTAPAQSAPSAACAETPAVDDAGELQRKWADVVARVVAAQPSRGALLQSARARHDDGSQLTVAFPKGSAFAIKMVGRPDSQAIVLPIVCEVFGQRTVSYVMDGGDGSASSGSSGASVDGGGAVTSNAAPVAAQAQARAAAAPTQAKAAAPVSSQVPVAPASASIGAVQASGPAQGNARAASAADAARMDAAFMPARMSGGAPTAPARGNAPGQGHPTPAPMPNAAGAPVAATPGSRVSVSPASTPASSGAASAQAVAAAGPAASATASRAEVDQASGPTIVPEPDIEAQRKAWEDEQVPYDDAMIDAYAEDDEAPPFDAPATLVPEPARVGMSAAAAGKMDRGVSSGECDTPAVGTSASPLSGAGEMSPSVSATSRAASASSAGAVPWAAQSDTPEGVPQTKEEAEDLLNSIFGAGVVIKPAD